MLSLASPLVVGFDAERGIDGKLLRFELVEEIPKLSLGAYRWRAASQR
jgi:hypothetical protein